MSVNLWTARASTSPELDRLEVRPLTPDEVERIRRDVQLRDDESPFRCNCLKCVLERRERGR